MSHSTPVSVEGTLFYCHHNGDYSGDISVVCPEVTADGRPTVEEKNYIDVGKRITVRIPFEVMKELVGSYMQSQAIRYIESMYGREYVDARSH